MASLGVKEVEVQRARQLLPDLETGLVEASAVRGEVVGANDRRVATGAAAADVTLFEHGHVGDAVLGGEVVRRRQTMSAAADDDDVVFVLEASRRTEHAWLGIAASKGELQQAKRHCGESQAGWAMRLRYEE